MVGCPSRLVHSILSVGLFYLLNLVGFYGFLGFFIQKDGYQSSLTMTFLPMIVKEEQQQEKKKISALLDLGYNMYLSYIICVTQVEL